MTDSGTEGAPRLAALLPPERAGGVDEAGVNKAPVDALGTLALAVLAGGVIPP